jgi:uncharacterized protein YbaP (TraB family)
MELEIELEIELEMEPEPLEEEYYKKLKKLNTKLMLPVLMLIKKMPLWMLNSILYMKHKTSMKKWEIYPKKKTV